MMKKNDVCKSKSGPRRGKKNVVYCTWNLFQGVVFVIGSFTFALH